MIPEQLSTKQRVSPQKSWSKDMTGHIRNFIHGRTSSRQASDTTIWSNNWHTSFIWVVGKNSSHSGTSWFSMDTSIECCQCWKVYCPIHVIMRKKNQNFQRDFLFMAQNISIILSKGIHAVVPCEKHAFIPYTITIGNKLIINSEDIRFF